MVDINYVKDFEGALIVDKINRKYFSGIDIEEGYYIVSKSPVYLADSRYYFALKQQAEKLNLDCKLYVDINSIKEVIESQNIKRLYIDFDTTTLTEYEQLKSLNVELVNGSEFKKLRAVKTPKEIENIKKACIITEKAVEYAISKLKVGITEKKVKEIIVNYMIDNGAEGESFDTIVAFSNNSAVAHHQTGSDKLKNNSVVLIDTGCVVNGYCSDITRTVFFGTPDQEFIDRYNAVLRANEKAIQEITCSTFTNQADGIARDYLKSLNLSQYFTHSLGHGVGLEIHEHPFLSPKKEDLLTDNVVFTIEPGVYFENQYGIRIEDTVLLKDGKVERLFTDSKKLKIIK